jgi:hypothetical protein
MWVGVHHHTDTTQSNAGTAYEAQLWLMQKQGMENKQWKLTKSET